MGAIDGREASARKPTTARSSRAASQNAPRFDMFSCASRALLTIYVIVSALADSIRDRGKPPVGAAHAMIIHRRSLIAARRLERSAQKFSLRCGRQA